MLPYKPFIALLLVLMGISAAAQSIERIEPEQVFSDKAAVSSVHGQAGGVCVAANPYASKTCLEILRAGGSAADAAIAAAFVLGLVEPQSSGLGGGGYALYHSANSVLSYDGRETAPISAKDSRFLGPSGAPLSFTQAVHSPLSIGVPSMSALMAALHEREGRLNWNVLLEPAILLATQGFSVSERMSQSIASSPELKLTEAKNAFYEDNQPLPSGYRLKNPSYARTLSALSLDPQSLYTGALSSKLLAALHRIGSDISAVDLSSYAVKIRPALCRKLPQVDQAEPMSLCAPTPSTSGGIALLQIMQSLPADLDLNSAQGLTTLTNAQALSFADRGLWVADDQFFEVPTDLLLSRAYLDNRGKLSQRPFSIPQDQVLSGIAPLANTPAKDTPNTTHISVVDAWGEAISMTLSVESAFGSKYYASDLGFIFNNELTDFDFNPSSAIGLAANRVEGGKRPRSSMTPVIVLDSSGEVFGVLGSPGGSRIIGFVTSALLRLTQGESVERSVSSPHVLRRFSQTELEPELGSDMIDQLKDSGHTLKIEPMASGLAVIWRSAKSTTTHPIFDGAADPRREGLALGISETP